MKRDAVTKGGIGRLGVLTWCILQNMKLPNLQRELQCLSMQPLQHLLTLTCLADLYHSIPRALSTEY